MTVVIRSQIFANVASFAVQIPQRILQNYFFWYHLTKISLRNFKEKTSPFSQKFEITLK